MPDASTLVDPVAEVMERAKSLTHSQRIALAKQLLDSLEVAEPPPTTLGNAPPPDDEQVRLWIDEYRMGKYG